jgi:hypothetical protein
MVKGGIGAKNINDCPALTLKFNTTYGQSFMFFAQVNIAGIHFKVLETCGDGDSLLSFL